MLRDNSCSPDHLTGPQAVQLQPRIPNFGSQSRDQRENEILGGRWGTRWGLGGYILEWRVQKNQRWMDANGRV